MKRILRRANNMALTLSREPHRVMAVAVAKAKRSSLDERMEAFRSLVKEAIRKADDLGLELKPYDGAVGLSWPSMVSADRKARRYTLRLSCSVLGGHSSHFSWSGRSWRAVFTHAAEDVAYWTELMERGESDASE